MKLMVKNGLEKQVGIIMNQILHINLQLHKQSVILM